METYEYWKKKWDNPYERSLFGTDPKYPLSLNLTFQWRLPNYDLHRWDGPALIWDQNVLEWYFYGVRVGYYSPYFETYTGKFYDWTIEQGMDIENLTDEDVTLIKMIWG